MSEMFTATASRTGAMLKRLPPNCGTSESRIVTLAPSRTRRIARLLPRKPSPPVISTLRPRKSSRAIMAGCRGCPAAIDAFANDVLRPAVLLEEQPSQVFADHPQREQLDAADDEQRHDHRSPAGRDLGMRQPIDDERGGQHQPDQRRDQPRVGGQPQRQDREVREHVQVQREQACAAYSPSGPRGALRAPPARANSCASCAAPGRRYTDTGRRTSPARRRRTG